MKGGSGERERERERDGGKEKLLVGLNKLPGEFVNWVFSCQLWFTRTVVSEKHYT